MNELERRVSNLEATRVERMPLIVFAGARTKAIERDLEEANKTGRKVIFWPVPRPKYC